MASTPTFVPSTGAAARLGAPVPAARTCARRAAPRRAPASTVRMGAGLPPPPPSSDGGEGGHPSDADSARGRLERQLLLTLVPTNVHADGAPKDGRTGCLWCAGSGRAKCTWCKGTGTRTETVLKSWAELTQDIDNALAGEPVPQPTTVPVQCSCCKGTTEMRCVKCRGSGTGSYGHAY